MDDDEYYYGTNDNGKPPKKPSFLSEIIKNKKIVLPALGGLILVVALVVILTKGGGDKPEIITSAMKTEAPNSSAAPAATARPTEAPKPTDTPAPTAPAYINLITGEPLEEEIAKRRAVAVVINNAPKALPQSGLSQASIYYEVLAEGDITRIITIFQNFNAEKIGSVRSARDYFFNFAYDHDALFVHHGGSPEAYKTIRGHLIDYFDGQDLDGTMFWRDQTRWNTSGMREHSSYTKAENIWAQAEKYGYRTTKNDDYAGLFKFYATPSTPPNSVPLKPDKDGFDVVAAYLSWTRAEFKYDEKTHLFVKWQNGKPHMDAEFDVQLSVTNVLIQEAETRIVDNEGRRSVKLVSEGRGLLATNGAYVPVKWKKTSSTSPTVWTFENGEPLTLNIGKTWVCVVPNLDNVILG